MTHRKAKQLGAECMAGGSWDQFLFPTREAADEFVSWLSDRGLSYQIVGWVDGKYRVRAR